ncbi:MAG TPA: bifunctional phosphoribosyl-AMP cyclohydrolase/phosphoribosyl-ATP diphosphatase HisIE [Herpetosiphonaceae bacterium]
MTKPASRWSSPATATSATRLKQGGAATRAAHRTDTAMTSLKFDDRGLIPAIVQDAGSGEVLMLGYMNQEALDRTAETGLVTFWSRSRNELWTKGATSGNHLKLAGLRVDCDSDALLVLAEPVGPTCHTGARSCFASDLAGDGQPAPPVASSIAGQLFALLRERDRERPAGSYTTYLLEKGVDKIGKKIGEEAAEVIIAAKNNDPDELRNEASDLLYHLFVLLLNQGLAPDAVWQTLRARHAGSEAKPE